MFGSFEDNINIVRRKTPQDREIPIIIDVENVDSDEQNKNQDIDLDKE